MLRKCSEIYGGIILCKESNDSFTQNVPEQQMVQFSLHVLVENKQSLELEWLLCRQ
jgi:hypothetical protein